ncbi:MAG TPA: AI-2E family transporter YdiK, partial [Candidatus Binatia bacterium]|nr:AI-2E family transporter YdiK [Candidatus Binatia bacterium]
SDITRGVLAVLFIVGLIGASIWILRPFLGALVWSTTIVVATWPLMIALQRRLWNKRALAVVVMTVLLLAVLFVPLTLTIATVISNVDDVALWLKSLGPFNTGAPPDWLVQLPLVGPRVSEWWQRAVAAGVPDIATKALPYAGALAAWFAAQVGNLGFLLIEFLLTVILAAAMYANGEAAAARLVRFGGRLSGASGENAIVLAGQTIRGVALGVVVTALVQTSFATLGLFIAGVPFAGVLSGAMFVLAIAQIGIFPVLAPVVAWYYWSGASGWATFLLVWTLIAGPMDNFLRPVLIRKSADLPLLLIFAGVVGGLIAFGLIGIFIGPVVLAVADALVNAWIDADLKARPAVEPPVSL